MAEFCNKCAKENGLYPDIYPLLCEGCGEYFERMDLIIKIKKQMKKLLLLTAILCSNLILAQENFSYNEEGLTPEYIVLEKESMTQEQLYTKAINWIKETYKNPDKVIKAQIENEKVRFEGVEMDLICRSALGTSHCFNATYTIEIEFREGKSKFTPTNLTYRIPRSQYNAEMIEDVSFLSGEKYYKRNGKLKGVTKSLPEAVEKHFSTLYSSYYNYINESSSEKEEW